jgi:hypothetical protein
MFAKIATALCAALVLTGVSLTFVSNASAAPLQGVSQSEESWMNRASAPDTEQNAFGY